MYYRMYRSYALAAAILLVSFTFAGLYFTKNAQDVHKPTTAVGTTVTFVNTDDTAMADLMSSSTQAMNTATTTDHFTPGHPTHNSATSAKSSDMHNSTLPATSQVISGSSEEYSESATVVFGREGSEPGRFNRNYGVAVSADKEIFVTDMRNKRVQVFSMDGVFLRLFTTVVPGEEVRKIQPCGAAIDVEGHFWLVGYSVEMGVSLHVVQYNKSGLPMTTFVEHSWAPYPSIAVDLRNNRIVVVASTQIFILQSNGTIYRRFETEQRLDFSYVTTDLEGNIFATDTSHSIVHVYDHFGQRRFTFGDVGLGKEKHVLPRGICFSRSGRILVADWANGEIDMFTSRGEFVRTVVNITNPWGIAVGPDGQLVVTNIQDNTVTIFPRQTVLN
ncbi:tripartite motif-containing protein 3-like isoform X1 [Branchiostoma lanceolatum]|uniref:tripartite motif-containing protein 3-like isoform X1 n=1 Tax=Branchiostoma lanceolatum TaxID=7740 RepID=UPI003452EC74